MSENNKFYFSLSFFILLSLTALAVPAVANAQPVSPSSYGMTTGRLMASTAAVLGLIGVVIGSLALARPNSRFGTASGQLGAIVALAMGLIGITLGGIVLATANGGIGTGNGVAGAIVALVLGLIGVIIGGMALPRTRRTG